MTISSPLPTPAERLEWWNAKVWARWVKKLCKRATVGYAAWVTEQLKDTMMPVLLLVALAVLAAIVSPVVGDKILAATMGLALFAHVSYFAMYDLAQEKSYRDISTWFFWVSTDVVLVLCAAMSLLSVGSWIATH